MSNARFFIKKNIKVIDKIYLPPLNCIAIGRFNPLLYRRISFDVWDANSKNQ